MTTLAEAKRLFKTVLLCVLLGLLLTSIGVRVEAQNAVPPEVDYSGLKTQTIYDVPTKPYELYFTEEDAIAVAQTLWGEARGCTLDDKQNVVRVICNRCDDSRYPDTPYAVATQSCQFFGYSPNNPIDQELYDIAVSIMTDWSLMKQGVPCEWNGYLYFTGNGVYNTFRTEY